VAIEATGESRAERRAVGTHVALLYAARAVRGFGDGFAVIILPAYLAELGFGSLQIGVVATSALLGTAVMTLAVGHLASRYDIRNLLLASALVMFATGLAFANVALLPLVVIVAFGGTVNPSSGDIGIFVPLEHAMLAKDAADRDRTRVFARYSLIGGLATARWELPRPICSLQLASASSQRSKRCSTRTARWASGVLLSTDGFHMFETRANSEVLPSGHRAASSTGLLRCSAWTHSPGVSLYSRSSRFGSLNALTCRLALQVCFSFGRIHSPLSPILSLRVCRSASASSTRWCLPIFHRASA
jgi:MFS family permease